MRYDYECRRCKLTFELSVPLKDVEDKKPQECPVCKKTEHMHRVILKAPPFKIKGACAANGYSDLLGDDPKFQAGTFSNNDVEE